MSALNSYLPQAGAVVVRQVRQAIEFFGVEARNKYDIFTPEGQPLARAEERPQGILGLFTRQFLRHWRTFSIDVSDASGTPLLHFHHPFRFFFQRLDLYDPQGQEIGCMERQLSFTLAREFLIEDRGQSPALVMRAPFWRIWTYPVYRNGVEVARIQKKWGDFLTEMFTDADTFLIQFLDPALSLVDKQLILGAAVLIDIQYFEDNQAANVWSFFDRR